MNRCYATKSGFSTRELYVDLSRSRIAHSADERRLNLTIRTAACRRLMNSDAEIRGCMKAV